MDNVDLNVLRRLAAWEAAGHAAVLGTVTRTWGSAPRPAGSVVAVRDDGLIAGSVSGGCIEDDLIDKGRGNPLGLTTPQVVRYGVAADEAQRFGLPCGGTLELVLEPVTARSRIGELLAMLDAGLRVRREVVLADGTVGLRAAGPGDTLSLDDRHLVTTHGPRWRLLLIGAGQLSSYVARIALALDYEVTVCDPRSDYAIDADLHGVTRTTAMPDDAVTALRPDGHTAIVALTHDPKLDDLALMEALRSAAFYVGAIGSRLNQARRRARLSAHFSLTTRELDQLHGPVGLHIGARTPPEIALSVLAEMTAVRYGVAAGRAAQASPRDVAADGAAEADDRAADEAAGCAL